MTWAALFCTRMLFWRPGGEEPDEYMLLAGTELARKRRPIESTFGNSQVVLGKWSNGTRLTDVEFSVWLSPAMLARWLGYLQEREGWGKAELDRRWSALQRQIAGKIVIVTKLCSLEKQDPLELESPRRPDGLGLEDVNVHFSVGQNAILPNELYRTEVLSRSASEIANLKWYAVVPNYDALRPDGTPKFERGYALGWNRALFIVTTFDPPLPGNPEIEIAITSKGKTRRARLTLDGG